MRINFKGMELSGFRSFANAIKVSFERAAGLYFIGGRNEVEPSLGPNGVGKSSFLEGFFWICFGVMSNGVKAGNLSTWGSDSAAGRIYFDRDGTEHVLERTRGPNTLRLDGRDVTQADVERAIGMTREVAGSTLLVGQFADTFIEKSNAERLEVFAGLLNLSRWEGYSKEASESNKKVAKEINRLQLEEAAVAGRLQQIDMPSLLTLEANWLKQNMLDIEALKNQQEACQLAIAEAMDKERAAKAAVTLIAVSSVPPLELPAFVPPTPSPALDDMNRRAAVLMKELAVIVHNRTILNGQLSQLTGVVETGVCTICGANCTTCANDAAHKEQAIKDKRIKISMDLSLLNEEAAPLEQSQAALNMHYTALLRADARVLAEAKETYNKLCWQLRDTWNASMQNQRRQEEERNAAKEVATAATLRLAGLNQQARTIRADLDKANDASNPYSLQVKKAEKDQTLLKAQAETLHKEVLEYQELSDALDAWVSHFKKIRLLSVQTALRELEIAVNDGLVRLGMQGWAVLLEAERELGNGSYKREFVINVKSPYNEELVPWEVWSGGERQRLRLAFLFGLQTFMAGRAGVQTNLFMLDEPSNWLSKEGIEDMVEFLRDKAERDNLVVLLADHRTLDYGGFAGRFTIVKTKNGSHIEEK
jgi:DNA repair exonuclease SbcCD ATPase subunit